jgi:hypothetical protein
MIFPPHKSHRPSELESLRPVIEWQQKALKAQINLSLLCLNFTRLLKRRELLKTAKKKNGGLRIKCKLTTSPAYKENPDFINPLGLTGLFFLPYRF